MKIARNKDNTVISCENERNNVHLNHPHIRSGRNIRKIYRNLIFMDFVFIEGIEFKNGMKNGQHFVDFSSSIYVPRLLLKRDSILLKIFYKVLNSDYSD